MNERDRLLIDALKRLRRVERRVTGWSNAVTSATKQTDRRYLASEADGIRLDLDHLYGLIENEIDCRIREDNA